MGGKVREDEGLGELDGDGRNGETLVAGGRGKKGRRNIRAKLFRKQWCGQSRDKTL